jgi:type IV pilus assembly protein PilQ
MKSSITKFHRLGLFILLMVITAGHVAAADSNDSNAAGKEVLAANDSNTAGKEVLSTLAQRMQKRISVDFRNTPIDDVLRMIADQSGVDMIKSPKVIGNVTATFTNIPLDEALNNILISQGYGYVASNNMIRVLPREEMSEVSERLVNKIYQIYYADVKEVEASLKRFVSSRGSLSSNPGTSNIIVTDGESKIKAIDEFIKEIDRITPQVEVEARIYDITHKDKLDLGVEWQAGRNTTFSGTKGIEGLGINPSNGTNPFNTGAFSGDTMKTLDTTGVLRFGWLTPQLDIDVLLRAQQENIDAKLLANPRVLVLDNEKALFDIITEYPYIERTLDGATTTETVKFKEVGVKLEVTPHVTRDGMLRLKIVPEFGVKVGDVTTVSGGTVPIVNTRKVDTITLVRDGQTVVIGGLRKKEATKQVNKVPFLGDMPVVGMAFRFQGEDSTISELVIFITPRIIDNPVLTPTELEQLKVTDFNGPQPIYTGAEKPIAKKTPRVIENPVLTPTEQQQLSVTDFNGPSPVYTIAEKPIAKKMAKKKHN